MKEGNDIISSYLKSCQIRMKFEMRKICYFENPP
uniref:Uncharacterized protein n=1 Tax=Rhizophora mucronata TaxID=61149 RepID=A0A2P2PD10_RHIMU